MVDGEILEKVAVMAPTKLLTEKSKKGILQGNRNKLILPQVMPTAERRSVSEEDKHAYVLVPRCKHVSARFPVLYKALLEELDPVTCSAVLSSALRVSR